MSEAVIWGDPNPAPVVCEESSPATSGPPRSTTRGLSQFLGPGPSQAALPGPSLIPPSSSTTEPSTPAALDLSLIAAPLQSCLLCNQQAIEPVSLYCCPGIYCNNCLADHYYEVNRGPGNARCKLCGRVILFVPSQTQALVDLKRKNAAFAAAQLEGSLKYHPYRRPPTSGTGLVNAPSSSLTSNAEIPPARVGQFFPENTVSTPFSSTTVHITAEIQPLNNSFIREVLGFRWDQTPSPGNSIQPAMETISSESELSSGTIEEEEEGDEDEETSAAESSDSEVAQTDSPTREENSEDDWEYEPTPVERHVTKSRIIAPLVTERQQPSKTNNELVLNYLSCTNTQIELANKFSNDFDFSPKALDMLKAAQEANMKKPSKLYGVVCMICLDSSKEPVKSRCCQRTACKNCWSTVYQKDFLCPGCFKQILGDADDSYIPLDLYSCLKTPKALSASLDCVDYKDWLGKFEDLDEYSISALLHILESVRAEKYAVKEDGSKKTQELMRLTGAGLIDLVHKYKKDLSVLRFQMDIAIQDLKYLDGRVAKESSVYGSYFGVGMDSSNPEHRDPSFDSSPEEAGPADTPEVNVKVDRLREHFDTFSVAVSQTFRKFGVYNNEDPAASTLNRVNALLEVSEGITKYQNVEKTATLNYDMPIPAMSIITGLAFDSTAERFIVAGEVKKIKVFNFNDLLENPHGPHFPDAILKNKNKVTSVSWSHGQNSVVAAADYDGHVSIWDVEKSTDNAVKIFRDHTKRCLAVDFNKLTPNIFASGSEDHKVKLYNVNCNKSVLQINCSMIICCVHFSPFNSNYLLYGLADHNLHLVDLRKSHQSLTVFQGHSRAVSYARCINPTEVVTASTDSTLRVWDIESGNCLNILKGHQNEKNFVGLDNNGDHLVCGSENSKCFFYYKGLQEPVAEKIIAKECSPNLMSEGFVSAVAWKPNSDFVLTANSCGRVHLLHLS